MNVVDVEGSWGGGVKKKKTKERKEVSQRCRKGVLGGQRWILFLFFFFVPLELSSRPFVLHNVVRLPSAGAKVVRTTHVK